MLHSLDTARVSSAFNPFAQSGLDPSFLNELVSAAVEQHVPGKSPSAGRILKDKIDDADKEKLKAAIAGTLDASGGTTPTAAAAAAALVGAAAVVTVPVVAAAARGLAPATAAKEAGDA